MKIELKDYPKKVFLKDNYPIILRNMVKEDKEALIRFFRNLPEEDRLFLKEDVTNEEVIKRWFEQIDYSKVLPIIAEADGGVIVGDATLHRNNYGWSKHVGEIRIVVAREFQKRGLGSILAKELIRHAQNFGLDKIVAEMMDKQISAQNAFKKLGFIEEAVLKNHVTDIHGIKRDLIIMSNEVGLLWETMEDLISDYRYGA